MQLYDLPIADWFNCSVGFTVTVTGSLVGPDNSITPISAYPIDSIAVYSFNVKSAVTTYRKMVLNKK